MNPEIFHSFNYWSKNGYKINKGAKSTRRNTKGIPLFSSRQIQKINIGCGERNHWDKSNTNFDEYYDCFGGDPMDYGNS